MTGLPQALGRALYDLAREEELDGQMLSEIEALERCFRSEPEFPVLLDCPGLTKEARCQVLDDCFRGNFQPYLLNTLKILTEKRAMGRFALFAEAYRDQYRRSRGILRVTAATAVPLTREQRDRLLRKLRRLTGRPIELEVTIEPGILGGIRLDYDGKRLDGTLAGRLEALASMLNNAGS